MVPGTAAAWGVALTTGKYWEEQRDRERVRDGFDRLLASGLTRWPQPVKLMEVLPEPKALRIEGSTRPDPNDPYEIQHQRRLAEYAEASRLSAEATERHRTEVPHGTSAAKAS